MVNLYGEKDLNIYMFNKIGIFLKYFVGIGLLVYFFIQLDKMNKSYYDVFFSVLTDYDHELNTANNLDKDSNFMMFFELKFENSTIVNELGVTK